MSSSSAAPWKPADRLLGVVSEVDRREWGLVWNALETGGFLLANNVRLEIEAELIKK